MDVPFASHPVKNLSSLDSISKNVIYCRMTDVMSEQ